MYHVIKDGAVLKEYKSLTAANKLADTECAVVYDDDGDAVYPDADSVSVLSDVVVIEAVDIQPPATEVTEAPNNTGAPYVIMTEVPLFEVSGGLIRMLQPRTVVNVKQIIGDYVYTDEGKLPYYGGRSVARKYTGPRNA